ncbi:hypothetical protein M422DRAFT_27072 [Sphaerobolus stellatus SS14]|nr:hypothetical protein M422DRAFT_27072 [Sphaerobolus stellatus SS14]
MVWVASLVKAAPAERPLTCFASSSIEHCSMERIRPHDGHISLNRVYGLSEEPRHAGGFSTSPPRVVEMDSPSLSPFHSIETQGYVLNDLTSDISFQSPENSPRTVLPPFLSGINVPSTSTRLPSIFSANYALDYLHNRYRKLANRDYYPSPHHQAQFDTLQHHDPSTFKRLDLVGLNSLDGDIEQPPLYAMPLIIECAILGSPQQRLTLSELRLTLKKRFRYYEKEEGKGVKSWERTLLQNLSKKERFVKIERPEPGQGGYWTINPDAPPSNRARKRISRQRPQSPSAVKIQSLVLSNPDPTWVSASSTSAAVLDTPSSRELGGPSSSFPSFPTDRYPDGKLKGRYSLSIRLPQVQRKRQEDICPSSPRYWLFPDVNGSHVAGIPGNSAPQRPSHGD